MNVLHICNGFTTSRLYDELFCQFENQAIKQFVIAPSFRGEVRVSINGTYHIEYFERNTNILSRLRYSHKIKQITTAAKKYSNQVDIIHAHTWYSDGFVAYNLSQEYNKPFIVAIRNSDINFFFRYFIHLRKNAYQVLKLASAIILISPCYYNRLKAILPLDIFEEIKKKIHIITNGINEAWLTNRQFHTTISKTPHIVFCGNFDKNKNILGLINAVNIIQHNGYNCKLSLIGKNGNNRITKEIEKLAQNSQIKIDIYNRMSPEELRQFYRTADIFAMPSFTETFGLVYIEALSQGLPIVYTKNEGIDGLFNNESIGIATNPKDSKDIAKDISTIINNYETYTAEIQKLNLNDFQWSTIADKYNEIYCNRKINL